MPSDTPLEQQLQARRPAFEHDLQTIRTRFTQLGEDARREIREELTQVEAQWQRAWRILHEQPSLGRDAWEEAEQRLADIKRRLTC